MNNLSRVEVMLDIFSGRPNPRWTLSDEQVNDLQARLRALPESTPVIPPGLGYRGFIVTNPANDPRLPGRIGAFASVITSTNAQATSYYQDANNIEGWLIDQARERGFGDVIDRFRGTNIQ
jgi:hypothetical protein